MNTSDARASHPRLTTALLATQLFWAGTMWYSQFNTYPLFAAVSPDDFGSIHTAYEMGLPIGVYIPFSLALLVGLFAIVRLRRSAGPIWLFALGGGLAGGVLTTAFGAAPLHIWLIENGQDLAKVEDLLAWNGARTAAALIAAIASIAIVHRGWFGQSHERAEAGSPS